MTMRKGRAIGGPRDNVIIQASQHWTGFIRNHSGNRYVWSSHDNAWVWTPCTAAVVNDFIHMDEPPRRNRSSKKSTANEHMT